MPFVSLLCNETRSLQSLNDDAFYRTAPATPGLLINAGILKGFKVIITGSTNETTGTNIIMLLGAALLPPVPGAWHQPSW